MVELSTIRTLHLVMELPPKVAVAIKEEVHQVVTKDRRPHRNVTRRLHRIQRVTRQTTRVLPRYTCSKCKERQLMRLKVNQSNKTTRATMQTTMPSSSNSSEGQPWTSTMLSNSLTTQVQDSNHSLMSLVLRQPMVFRVPQIHSNNSMPTTTISSTMLDITTDKRIKPLLNMLLPVNLGWHKRLRELMATPDLRLRIRATKRLEGGMEIGKSSHADVKVSESQKA